MHASRTYVQYFDIALSFVTVKCMIDFVTKKINSKTEGKFFHSLVLQTSVILLDSSNEIGFYLHTTRVVG